jgi:hypothetical protein
MTLYISQFMKSTICRSVYIDMYMILLYYYQYYTKIYLVWLMHGKGSSFCFIFPSNVPLAFCWDSSFLMKFLRSKKESNIICSWSLELSENSVRNLETKLDIVSDSMTSLIFLLLCCTQVHCGIYKDSYNVSNVSYLNPPPPQFGILLPSLVE